MIRLVCCLLLALVPLRSEAAGLRVRAEVSAGDLFNPVPASGDITLPMPCNLSMVFRAVAVPARGRLWDMNFNMGNENAAQEGLDYYDKRFPAAISAPFGAADLPTSWREALPKDAQTSLYYYFIGKYELSEGQWDAVMGETCPAPSESAAKPKRELSWYEAQDFTRRYNQWLIENAPESLPHFAGDERNIGFTRLPTEPEWEFAARGGSAVPADNLRQEDFHPLADGTSRADYAVYRSAGAVQEEPLRIGSRKANPLGIHDMAGNVAEMVQDAFRFSVGGRLHGSAGGFVRKGGGYTAGDAEILPGHREEVAHMNSRGPVTSRDLGLRLVLSGINTPGGPRSDELRAEWSRLGEDPALLTAMSTPGNTSAPSVAPTPTPEKGAGQGGTATGKTPADANAAGTPPAGGSSTSGSLAGTGSVGAPGTNPAPSAFAGLVLEGDNPLGAVDRLLAVAEPGPLREHLGKLRVMIKDANVSLERQRTATAESLIRTMLYMDETMRNYGVRHDIAYRRTQEIQKLLNEKIRTKAPAAEIDALRKNLALFEQARKEMILAMESSANFYKSKLDEVLTYPPDIVNYNLGLVGQELAQDNLLAKNMRQNLEMVRAHIERGRAGQFRDLTRTRILKDVLPENLQPGLGL